MKSRQVRIHPAKNDIWSRLQQGREFTWEIVCICVVASVLWEAWDLNFPASILIQSSDTWICSSLVRLRKTADYLAFCPAEAVDYVQSGFQVRKHFQVGLQKLLEMSIKTICVLSCYKSLKSEKNQ